MGEGKWESRGDGRMKDGEWESWKEGKEERGNRAGKGGIGSGKE